MNTKRAPKVFITQVPSRRDNESNLWVPTVNYSPAKKFGEVEIILPAGSQFYAPDETVRVIKARLKELDFQQGDYLLPMGSPVIMAVTAAIAARRCGGCLNILSWDKHSDGYEVATLDNLI